MRIAVDFRTALDPAALFAAAFGLDPLTWQVGYLRETRPTLTLKGRQVGASMAAAALAITAARALVATGGRVVVQSTPDAERGDFHELVNGDDPAWARLTVRSDSVATISPEFLAAERRAMAPDAFATEYECTFGKAGASLF